MGGGTVNVLVSVVVDVYSKLMDMVACVLRGWVEIVLFQDVNLG